MAALAAAQTVQPEKAPEATFRVGMDLVQLNVSVFDPSGQIIKGLTQSAFTILENNVKQQISVFRQEDVPVSLGLVIDNSASMEKKKDRVASSALAMVKASNPADEVFIINFNEEADIVQDFTNDPALLEKSLHKLGAKGETAMRDAALLGIEHFDRAVIERRANHDPNLALRACEVDRVILSHLVGRHRNCVGCGIVGEHDRFSAGRPRTGSIYSQDWRYHMAFLLNRFVPSTV